MNYKIIAIILFIIVFLYRQALTLLRLQSTRNPIPANVADIYDAETYAKWREYHRETCRLMTIRLKHSPKRRIQNASP